MVNETLSAINIRTTCFECKRPKQYSCVALSGRVTKAMREAAVNAPCFCCKKGIKK